MCQLNKKQITIHEMTKIEMIHDLHHLFQDVGSSCEN